MTNITSSGTITSASFLDSSNRFVLINYQGYSKIYDLQENNFIDLNGSFSGKTLSINYKGELFDESSTSITMFQIKI